MDRPATTWGVVFMSLRNLRMKLQCALLVLASSLPLSDKTRRRFEKSLHKRRAFLYSRALPFSYAPANNPLISVIVVSHNSSKDLPFALKSISNQSYQNIEVIVVENGSADTKGLTREICPNAIWIHSPENLGFAAGNNLAMEEARGEYVALVNPDARLDEDCLLEMLGAFRGSPGVAAVAPKIRFWTRFISVHLEATEMFRVSELSVVRQLNYKKIFLRQGARDGDALLAKKIDHDRFVMEITLPVDESKLALTVFSSGAVSIQRRGMLRSFSIPKSGEAVFEIPLSRSSAPDAHWLINNAGSALRNGMPADIGFAERDSCAFDVSQETDAFCGCVALIRRSSFIGRELFRREFFAYYEDSELSFWLRQNGWKIVFWPRAVAYHRHSSSTEENSVVWRALVSRSSRLYRHHTGTNVSARGVDNELFSDASYRELDEKLAETLRKLDESTTPVSRPTSRNIGVYNSYWNTMGGGEVHALQVVNFLAREGDTIFLISEEDFDLPRLCDFGGVPGERYRKIISSRVSGKDTSIFDLFINSTYHSNLRSEAEKSLYLLSFPHMNPDTEALASYRVLCNSSFTEDWARRRWGHIDSMVIYPTFSPALQAPKPISLGREKVILSVGRFSPDGHCKNQHAILNAFSSNKHCSGWTLKLVGSLDRSRRRDVEYFQSISSVPVPADRTVELLPNADLTELRSSLFSAQIYVHAAGLGRAASEPENHEHFGISVLEACIAGNFPIVYGVGGPAELIKHLGVGSVYWDKEGLTRVLGAAIEGIDQFDDQHISNSAKRFCDENDMRLRVLSSNLIRPT